MRMTIVILGCVACLVCLGACGGDDTEAIKSSITKLQKKLAGLNAEKAEMMTKNGPIKTASFKAMAAFKGAQRKGDADAIAAAKQARDEAAALAQEAVDAEKAIDDGIRDLKDKIASLKRKLR